jgi:hypothetical protein
MGMDGKEVADDVTLSFTQTFETEIPIMSTAICGSKIAFGQGFMEPCRHKQEMSHLSGEALCAYA